MNELHYEQYYRDMKIKAFIIITISVTDSNYNSPRNSFDTILIYEQKKWRN